jgi:hypothetical protein
MTQQQGQLTIQTKGNKYGKILIPSSKTRFKVFDRGSLTRAISIEDCMAAIKKESNLCSDKTIKLSNISQTLRYGYLTSWSISQLAERLKRKSELKVGVDTYRSLYSLDFEEFLRVIDSQIDFSNDSNLLIRMSYLAEQDSYKVRAILSDKYKVINNSHILHSLEKTVQRMRSEYNKNLYILDFVLDDGNMQLTVSNVNPEHIKKGDQFPALVISNSETGQGALNISSSTYRLWCSNGCYSLSSSEWSKRLIHLGKQELDESQLLVDMNSYMSKSSKLLEKWNIANSTPIRVLSDSRNENLKLNLKNIGIDVSEEIIEASFEVVDTRIEQSVGNMANLITKIAQTKDLSTQKEWTNKAFGLIVTV